MVRRLMAFLAILAFSLVLGACTGGADEDTTTVAPSSTSTTEPAFDPNAWATTYLVEVESEGALGEESAAGFGSGLVVGEEGLIVVPATAVVGADRVNVLIADEEFPVEGAVEAMAECSNLALVRVDHRFPDSVTLGAGSGPAAWLAWARDGEWETASSITSNPGPFAVSIDAKGDVVAMAIYRGEGIAGAEAAEVLAAMRRRDVAVELDFAGLDQPDGTVIVTGVNAGSDVAAAELGAGDIIVQVGSEPLTGGLAELCDAYPAATRSLEFVRDDITYEGEVGAEAFHPASWRTVDELKEAVVRVETDRASGSGFVVSSDGFILTNHHVVAGFTDVMISWDGGDRLIAGRVVGRSSCADLAVVDVDGSDYVFLEWSGAPIIAAQEVRVVGFPRGTTQLTFKPGEISKEQIEPDPSTPTTRVLEHSAQTNRGSSGGPVVNEHGEVVGVHYAAFVLEEAATREPFAIHGADASDYVPRLMQGDVDHLGARLGYFYDVDTGELRSVRVLAVDTDSLAGIMGLFGHADLGDVLLRFGSLLNAPRELAIRAICQEMQETTGPIPIAILRQADAEHYDGELRGAPLEVIPDPIFLSSPDDVVGTSVPGRWVSTPLGPNDDGDGYGLRAGLPGFDFNTKFGREPYMRLVASNASAEKWGSTTDRLAAEDYSGHCADQQVDNVPSDEFEGHMQIWSDCASGVEIHSYALFDRRQEPSPMVLLLVVDDVYSVAETSARAFGNLRVQPFPPPEPEENEG